MVKINKLIMGGETRLHKSMESHAAAINTSLWKGSKPE